MNNQMIGIGGVFALTAFLLVLRHLVLSIGQSSKSRYVRPIAPGGRFELETKAVQDDSWHLWSPDNAFGSSDRGEESARGAHRETVKAERSDFNPAK